MELEKVKRWLKIDGSDFDEEISDLISEAQSELALSGVPNVLESDDAYPLYRKALKYIITRDFESRGMEDFEDKTLTSLVLKLKASVGS
ncbi:head-tail connector protein [Macrococcus equi]|uniref:head-tail connector protein n=1 Tax=Macrococcus equi TaxID=3395462 RepID=UPI0039BE8345